ncbi:MAG: prolyl oligopeptidase family serine peptidase [Verrucomicrobiales bacterium]
MTQPLFAQSSNTGFNYPKAKKVDQVDDYHGIKVADPYRWLEDPDSPASREWIQAQNDITFKYLEQIPAREQLRSRLKELWNYERFGVPSQQGGRYFLTRNDGLQNQSVLYQMKNLNDEPKLLLDPNKLSPDGTTALKGYNVSEDGKWLAYGLSSAGSDWEEWRVRNVETGEDLSDLVKWAKFTSASWTQDGKGFFYGRTEAPNEKEKFQAANYHYKLYYHEVGTSQDKDLLVYERPDQKEWLFSGEATEDGKYLIITVSQGTDSRKRVYYKELKQGTTGTDQVREGSRVVELLNEFDAAYSFINNQGTTFYFETDLKAPRGKVVAIDIKNPDRNNWKEIVPETRDTLSFARMINGQLILGYMKDARSAVAIHSLDGAKIRDVELPGIGSVGGFSGEKNDKETFYSFSSFTTPASIYRYDLVTGKTTVFRQPKLTFEPEQFETTQVFYASKDGTKVPMFITHKKGLKLDGSNPTLLYGYGGFNISLTPSYSPSIIAWMEMGGVYAQPNLRGGGEYGEEWHQAGMKLNKQNVFDDFIGAAEWLIAKKYTRSEKLAIAGGSNGGLLVGACMTQRPELFKAALPAVGVMDMLRFPKFTIGWAWTADYGSPDNPEEFKAIYAYSPLHRLKPGTKYPSTMITTADHDDRVVPAHSFKFAAALQEAHGGENPVLIRIETKAGHGAGKPTSKVIEEAADRYAFLVKELGMKDPR